MKRLYITLGMVMFIACFLPVARADDTVKVTQVDPSHFPEVVLYVNVTDESGKPRALLKQEDFRLLEDGKAVEITDFAGIGEARPVDIVFVFDTTGSMSEEIDGLKNTCAEFAEKLRAANRDFGLGLVTFGDEIRAVYGGAGLTGNVEEFKSWIGSQWADGGDDTPEIALDSLKEATRLPYRETAQKILILITDAPPHTQGDGTPFSQVKADTLIDQLRDTGYTVYAVAYDDERYRRLATETHGEFYDLQRTTDFTGIIDKIGGEIASQYRLTYLSARPAYDGTRRAIEVEVSGQKAEGTYLEKHLISVRSSPLIAVGFLIPLSLALILPVLPKRKAAGQPANQPAPAATPAMREPALAVPDIVPQVGPPAGASPPRAQHGGVGKATPIAVAGQISCPNCGSAVRAGAKFCGQCRQPITAAAPVPPVATTVPPAPYCPNCGAPLRTGAMFCGACGHHKTG